jgi:hypothetical protein
MNALNDDKMTWESVFDYATEDISMYLWSLENWINPPEGYDQEYLLLLILNNRARSRSAISLIKENIPLEHYQNRDQLNILWQKGEKLLYNFIETNCEDIEKIINDKFVERLSQLEQDLNNIKRIAQDGDLMDDPEWVQDDLKETSHDFLLQFQGMVNSNEEIQSLGALKAVNLEKFTDNLKQIESLFKEYFGYFNPASDFLAAIRKREYNKNQWWLTNYPDPEDIKEEEVSDELLQTMISTFQKEGQKLELDCPQSDNAIAYAFGELSADENKLFHDHMLECRYCFDLVQDTRMTEIESKELDKKHVKVLPALEEALKSQKQDSLIIKLKDFTEQIKLPKAAIHLLAAGIAFVIIIYGINSSGPAKFNVDLSVTGRTITGSVMRGEISEYKKMNLEPNSVLKSGDSFKVKFKIDKDAFYYLVFKDSQGIFDLKDYGEIKSGETLIYPDQKKWSQLGYIQGIETIILIVSDSLIENFDTKKEELKGKKLKEVFAEAAIKEFSFKHE